MRKSIKEELEWLEGRVSTLQRMVDSMQIGIYYGCKSVSYSDSGYRLSYSDITIELAENRIINSITMQDAVVDVRRSNVYLEEVNESEIVVMVSFYNYVPSVNAVMSVSDAKSGRLSIRRELNEIVRINQIIEKKHDEMGRIYNNSGKKRGGVK